MKSGVIGWTAGIVTGALLLLLMVMGVQSLHRITPEPVQYWRQPDGRLVEIHEPYTGARA